MALVKHNNAMRDFVSYLRFGGLVEQYRCHGDKKTKVTVVNKGGRGDSVEKFSSPGLKTVSAVQLHKSVVDALFPTQGVEKLKELLGKVSETLGVDQGFNVKVTKGSGGQEYARITFANHDKLTEEGKKHFVAVLTGAVKEVLKQKGVNFGNDAVKVTAGNNRSYDVTDDFIRERLVPDQQRGVLDKHVKHLAHVFSKGWVDGNGVTVTDLRNSVNELFGAQTLSPTGGHRGASAPVAGTSGGDSGEQTSNVPGTKGGGTGSEQTGHRSNPQTQSQQSVPSDHLDPSELGKSVKALRIPVGFVGYMAAKHGVHQRYQQRPEDGAVSFANLFLPLLHQSGVSVVGHSIESQGNQRYLVLKLGRSGTEVSPHGVMWALGAMQKLVNQGYERNTTHPELAIRFDVTSPDGETVTVPSTHFKNMGHIDNHIARNFERTMFESFKDLLSVDPKTDDYSRKFGESFDRLRSYVRSDLSRLAQSGGLEEKEKQSIARWSKHLPVLSLVFGADKAQSFVQKVREKIKEIPGLQGIIVTDPEQGVNPHNKDTRYINFVVDTDQVPGEGQLKQKELRQLVANLRGHIKPIAVEHGVLRMMHYRGLGEPKKSGQRHSAPGTSRGDGGTTPKPDPAPTQLQVSGQLPSESDSGEGNHTPTVSAEGSANEGRSYRTPIGHVFDSRNERSHITASKRAVKNMNPSEHFNHAVFVSHDYLGQNPGFEKFLKNIASNYSDVIQGFRRKRTRNGYVYDFVFHGQNDPSQDSLATAARARSVMARLSTALAGFHYQLSQSTGRHFDNDHLLVKVNGQRFDLGATRQRFNLADLAYLPNQPDYHKHHYVWGQEMAKKYLVQREVERPFLDRALWGVPGAIKRGVGGVVGGLSRVTGSVLSGLGNLLKRAGGGGEKNIQVSAAQFARDVAKYRAGGGLRGFNPSSPAKTPPPLNKPPTGPQPGVGRFPGVLPGVVGGVKFPQLTSHTAGAPEHTSNGGGVGDQGAPLQHWLTKQHQAPGALMSNQVPVHYERFTGDMWGRGSGTVLPAQSQGGSDDISFTHATRVPPSTRGLKGSGPLNQRYPTLMFLAKRAGERILLHHGKIK